MPVELLSKQMQESAKESLWIVFRTNARKWQEFLLNCYQNKCKKVARIPVELLSEQLQKFPRKLC